MKKVGIVTIVEGHNYGNRLQNYALQTVLQKMGYEVETIHNTTGEEWRFCKSIKVKNVCYKPILSLYQSQRKFTCEKLSTKIRINKFDKFNIKYIKFSDFSLHKDKIPDNLNELYDYFVCGSDQIWNPNFGFISGLEFLEFAEEKKKISYAASFGVSQLKEEDKDRYRRYFETFPRISVREHAGVDIVKDLMEKDVRVHVDPTLLLTREEWLEIEKKPKGMGDKDYILTYFLGELSQKKKKEIDKLAKDNNYEIINLLDSNVLMNYTSDPSEFVYFINHAKLMCTDSFHGCVFSILMKTPFVAYKRDGHGMGMFSRIETLLDIVKLEDRVEMNMSDYNTVLQNDYNKTEDLLSIERKKSLEYLKVCFDQ